MTVRHYFARPPKSRATYKKDDEMQTATTNKTERPLAVSVKRGRELLDISNTTIWALIRDRHLETIKIGRKRLILFKSLEALLEKRAA